MVTVRPPLAVPPSVTVCKRRLGQSTFCPPPRWSISKMKKKNSDSSNSLPLALRALVWRRERAAGGADTGSAGAAAAPGRLLCRVTRLGAGARAWSQPG